MKPYARESKKMATSLDQPSASRMRRNLAVLAVDLMVDLVAVAVAEAEAEQSETN